MVLFVGCNDRGRLNTVCCSPRYTTSLKLQAVAVLLCYLLRKMESEFHPLVQPVSEYISLLLITYKPI